MQEGRMKMKDVKNLDLRNMLPFERHAKIFEFWNSLEEGQTLRITNDHEPKPLQYMFEAEYKGQFEWEYEQKGPKDWIFRIKKISKQNKKEEIKALLKQLHSGADTGKIKEEGKNLFRNLSPTDLALIEQEIIQEGVTRKEMRELCDVHLEIMKESLGKTDVNLKPGHPIHTMMEEHKMILGFLDKLKEVVKSLESAGGFGEAAGDIEMLEHISEHLVDADKHHQREEEVLFPILEQFGVTEPPEIMREEHEEIKPRKIALHKIAVNHSNMPYNDFLKSVKELADFLADNLPNHIYKEDNILYPMALQVIPEDKWQEIKKKCDEIGYCCFTPGVA